MIIPDWASSYFFISKNELGELQINGKLVYSERRVFRDKKKALEDECSNLIEWSTLPSYTIEEYARDYMFCNLALGFIDQGKAQIKKAAGGQGNDGTDHQHWIPECYLKEFAINGQIVKIERAFFKEFSPESIDISEELVNACKKFKKSVNPKSSDFRETGDIHGKLYSPHYELILSKIEGDYAALNDRRRIITLTTSEIPPVENLWDFIVLATFFLIFDHRTKEKFEHNIPAGMQRSYYLLT